jgi:hypothetical protein
VQLFQLQLKLLDLAEDLLAPGAEEHPLQLLHQKHEPFDLAGARAECCRVLLMVREQKRLQRSMIQSVKIGQAEGGGHERSMA